MTRWFRMYTDVLDDPKVQKLAPPLFKTWVNLLCLAGRNDGLLPAIDDIAFALRLDEETAAAHINELVARGLLDTGESLTPHNWAERQFKSDTAENAAERKRTQRAREKKRDAPNDTAPDVTVTDCDSHNDVTPPDTDTEQNRTDTHTEQARVCEGDPVHWQQVQDLLKNQSDDLDDWKIDFLHSIKWTPVLTKAQSEKLKAIREKLATQSNGPHVLPSVKRGTAAYEAWIAYYRKRGPTGFYEKLDALTVPSEFPPAEHAA